MIEEVCLLCLEAFISACNAACANAGKEAPSKCALNVKLLQVFILALPAGF
jgi:hypothetical protein